MTSDSARVPAELAALAEVRSSLADALGCEGWTGETAARVLTACTEAMANALAHGSRPGAGVDVAFTVSATAIRVWVLDEGRSGREAPLGAPGAPPPSSPNGRGLPLMHALADDVRVRRHGRGTEVRLGFSPSAAWSLRAYDAPVACGRPARPRR